ncbi:uncharacterized protein LOC128156046 [Crassostrea angulata]|uniref:uncharacterized protein LOC128156046 n=1 Tax=Magallana angulata TaxID=2784310 RepID=UPI0022B1DC31|nr:uncharacterized protein LOC128156046 [Crassostrea angulata]
MSQTSSQEKNIQTMSDEEKEKVSKSHGCFDGLKEEMNKIGNTIQKEFDVVGHKLTSEIHQHTHAPVLHNFVTGNKIQLVSKINGRALQVAKTDDGGFIVNGAGDLGPTAQNAIWTVINEGNNRVHIHNDFNYLAIISGQTQVMFFGAGAQVADETKFQLIAKGDNCVVLESANEYDRCVGVREDGTIKPALHCLPADEHAQFCVYVLEAPLVEKAIATKGE